MFTVFFNKPHFNIESSKLKSHKPNKGELGKNTHGRYAISLQGTPHHGITHSTA